MAPPVTVFENPWAKEKPKILLQAAAARHIDIVEIFLKLLPYFKQDGQGNIHDEALTLSEWRYICYLRFLDFSGESPNDFPPPWDVAIIWYCHLLSPTRFHRHLWDGKHRAYGLNHHQFPATRLLALINSGGWSDKKAEKKWQFFNRKKLGPELPYQLWRYPPWEVRRRSSILSMLSTSKPNSQIGEEPPIVMYNLNGTLCRPLWKDRWSLSDWSEVRTGRRLETCLYVVVHRRFGEQCELTIWPDLRDLRATLDRQIAFWKAAIHARDTQKDFDTIVGESVEDYERFIKLLARPPDKPSAASNLALDMDTLYRDEERARYSGNREFVPPNLVVDLLWHTHRLYPASYWTWSFAVTRRLIDYEPSTSATAARRTLAETRLEWRKKYHEDCPEYATMDDAGMGDYIADAAVVPAGHSARVKAKWILGGLNPVKGRNRYTKGVYCVYDGIYVPFEGSACSGDGGGGGGGDGGCGGDGGGGGE
ncbi:hypothetical protein CH063_02744 [Colletotrichum higginsianum]|uniref:Chloroperoxidase n=2 Tax=Colletotrichum higginsianum TaxID=80884 RepID=H1VP96_COLHI|nr:Chloroperoxidase [Colletotrichum higginsianum IMI 349063]OBR14506.1 Chloroperoxidase [Colletotrichum higginsianum IMI 349063]CCF42050.1 hypothetical protein CH063_02744 [Colletotrichum higginsianum]